MEKMNFNESKSLLNKLNKYLMEENIIQYFNLPDLLEIHKLTKKLGKMVERTSSFKIFLSILNKILPYKELTLNKFIYKESEDLEQFLDDKNLNDTNEIYLRKLVLSLLKSCKLIIKGCEIPSSIRSFKMNYLDKFKDIKFLDSLEITLTYLNRKACPFLVELITASRKLSEITLNVYNFEKNIFEALMESIKINNSIETFNLALFSEISRDNCIFITNHLISLKKFVKLINLEIKNENHFDDVLFFIQNLDNIEKIKKLDLSFIKLFDKGIEKVITALGSNKSIKEINLSGTSLTFEGLRALADETKRNHSIEVLNLSFNCIRVEGCQIIADVFRHNNTIKELNLTQANIDDEGVFYLVQSIKDSKSLQSFILSGNWIGEDGCKTLAEAIKVNQTLKKLNLSSNLINDEAMICLAEAMKLNNSLDELNLSSNCFGHMGLTALRDCLHNNQIMRKILLDSHKGELELLEPIKCNTKLNNLFSVGNYVKEI